jgi:hypothetical protein
MVCYASLDLCRDHVRVRDSRRSLCLMLMIPRRTYAESATKRSQVIGTSLAVGPHGFIVPVARRGSMVYVRRCSRRLISRTSASACRATPRKMDLVDGRHQSQAKVMIKRQSAARAATDAAEGACATQAWTSSRGRNARYYGRLSYLTTEQPRPFRNPNRAREFS